MTGRAFPDGFRWGTATAAHQVEGGNWNNDWWAWEHAPGTPCVEVSGDACDHFHRYPDDLRLLGALGFDNYRFSLEWSRIEPEDGEFSTAALDHYRRMAAECLANGLDPVVTFHHFTTPRWVAALGGWAEPATADLFARFCDRAAARLGDLLSRACTINEPNMVATIGYLAGDFPPGVRDRVRRRQVNDVFVAAHRKAADAIKAHTTAPVGITVAMTQMWPVGANDEERAQAEARAAHMLDGLEDPFLRAAAGDDFVGVQTYSRTRVGPAGVLGPEPGVELTGMGYEFWPASLGATIRRAWAVTGGTPIVVTENGIAATDDSRRIDYVRQALAGLLDCVADGIDVRGYTYWSLLDNFEWARGYGPRFGLVEVDRATQLRTVKASARWLGAVARANALDG